MSVLDRITQTRDERVRDLHLDLPVPTWGTDLIIRFNIMDRQEMDKFTQKDRSAEVDMDFLIKSTRCLYAHDPNKEQKGERMKENDEYVRLEDEETGVPMNWGQFGLAIGAPEPDRARAVVAYAFKDNAIAIGGMTARVLTWMQNTDTKVGSALVGE